MEEGCAVANGRRRSRAASTVRRSSSKNGGSFIAKGNWRAAGGGSSSRFTLPLVIEGLGDQPAIRFLQDDFDSTLGCLQLLLALAGERYTLFEQLHRIVQGELRTFQAADDFLEAGERALKIGLFRGFRFFGSR